MTDTRNEIEQTDRRGLSSDEMFSMTPTEMRRIVGGLDALLGDRVGRPPMHSSKPLLIIAEDIAGDW